MAIPKIELSISNVQFAMAGELANIGHTYIVYTDQHGHEYALEGFPGGNRSVHAPYGKLIISGAYQFVPYEKYHKDQQSHSRMLLFQGQEATTKINAAMLYARDIFGGAPNYLPVGQNSNTFAFLMLEVMELTNVALSSPALRNCGFNENQTCLPVGFGYNNANFPPGSVDVQHYKNLAANANLNIEELPSPGASDQEEHLTSEKEAFLQGYGVDTTSIPAPTKQLMAEHLDELIQLHKTAQQEAAKRQQQLLKSKQFMDACEGMRNTGKTLSQIGIDIGSELLYKGGALISSVVDIYQNIAILGGVLGAAPTGLAMLTPYSAIVMGIFTIFSLFRKSKSGTEPFAAVMQQLQMLSQQIQALHLEMREHFVQVYQNQQAIMETIFDATQFLSKQIDRRIDDVIDPMMYELSRVSDSLQTMYGVLFNQTHSISLHGLEDRIHRVNSYLDGDIGGLSVAQKRQKLFDDLLKLEVWLTQRASSNIYNGQICFQPKQSIHAMSHAFMLPAVSTATTKITYLTGLVGYLASQCQAFLLTDFPGEIKLNKLVNPQIWMNVANTYLRIREYLFAQGIEYDVRGEKLAEIKEVVENTIAFIQFLQRSPTLYQVLLDNFLEVITDVRKVLQETILSGFLEVEEHYKKYFETCGFHCDEQGFSMISAAYQARLKPIFKKYQDTLKTSAQNRMALLSRHVKWLTLCLTDRKTFVNALTALKDQNVNTKNILAMDIAKQFNVPINIFCHLVPTTVSYPSSSTYKTPLDIEHICRELKIPPLFLLAESLGVLKFHFQYVRHHNPNVWNVGFLMPDDRYCYTITIVIEVGDVQSKLYTVDCVGSLNNHEETRPMIALYGDMHSYWFNAYNVHIGEGRFIHPDEGKVANDTYYVLDRIAPFMGSPPILVKESVEFAKDLDLDKLYSDLIARISKRVEALQSTALVRLTGTANTDWASLQPVKEKAQTILSYLKAYLQLAGFSSDILQSVSALNENFLSQELTKYFLPASIQNIYSIQHQQESLLVNTAVWYDDEDINFVLNSYINSKLGGRSAGNSFLLAQIFRDNGKTYRVAVTPAIDRQGYASPITIWLNKFSQQAPEPNKPDDRRDVFDEVGEFLHEGKIGRVKIIFPYNLTNIHWLTGEIILERISRNQFTLAIYTHDPKGGGSMLLSNVQSIENVIRRRLNEILPVGAVINLKISCPVSSYRSRQSAIDGSSCGPITVEDIVKRVQGATLDVSEPHPVGVEAIRKQHLALIEWNGNTAIDRDGFINKHTKKVKVFDTDIENQVQYIRVLIQSIIDLKDVKHEGAKNFSDYFVSEIEQILQVSLKSINVFQTTHSLDEALVEFAPAFNAYENEEFSGDGSEDEAFDSELSAELEQFVVSRKQWMRMKSQDGTDQVLGSGSFGKTYAGKFLDRRTHQQRDIAIKTIRSNEIDSGTQNGAALRSVFFTEVKNLSQFCTPPARNVVFFQGITKHKSQVHGTRYSLLMEKADMSLEMFLDDIHRGIRPKLSWADKAKIIRDIANGLREIHSKKVNGPNEFMVHSDIKDANILLILKANGELVAKISDLGISKVRNRATTIGTVLPGERAGTKCWQAPEVLLGKEHQWSSDIFSFGLVMWRILSDGKPLFGESRDARLHLPSDVGQLYTKYYGILFSSERHLTFPVLADVPLKLQAVLNGCWRIHYRAELNSQEDISFKRTDTPRPTAEQVVQMLNHVIEKLSRSHGHQASASSSTITHSLR